MSSPLQPEFFALLGLDLFLALSLLTCLLDRHFPWQLPYVYQLAALIGFGQLLISKEFMGLFGDYMRFWYSLLYLIVALSNIVAVNLYLGIIKKILNYARVLMVTATFPSIILTAVFVTSYAQLATHPLMMIPLMSWEATFVGIVAFDTMVVGLGTYIFFKPKWWYIAFGASTAVMGASIYTFLKPSWGGSIFVISAIGLAITCVIILGVSIYVLIRMWLEVLKEKKKKEGGGTVV